MSADRLIDLLVAAAAFVAVYGLLVWISGGTA